MKPGPTSPGGLSSKCSRATSTRSAGPSSACKAATAWLWKATAATPGSRLVQIPISRLASGWMRPAGTTSKPFVATRLAPSQPMRIRLEHPRRPTHSVPLGLIRSTVPQRLATRCRRRCRHPSPHQPPCRDSQRIHSVLIRLPPQHRCRHPCPRQCLLRQLTPSADRPRQSQHRCQRLAPLRIRLAHPLPCLHQCRHPCPHPHRCRLQPIRSAPPQFRLILSVPVQRQ